MRSLAGRLLLLWWRLVPKDGSNDRSHSFPRAPHQVCRIVTMTTWSGVREVVEGPHQGPPTPGALRVGGNVNRRIAWGAAIVLFYAGAASAQSAASDRPSAPPPTTTETISAKPAAPSPVTSKWATTFYGFVEADFISDSTESFNDLAGNAAIARPGTFPAGFKRLTFGVRNSRLGFRLGAPTYAGIKASANVEMDFLGNQPPNASEASFFTSPTFRIRHALIKLESEYIDVVIGQYWQLFGFQPYFHPNTVEMQGVPGQIYSRSPQLRLSHIFKTDTVSVEVAAAASRPPQRDSHIPDGQAGIRFLLNSWKGVHTAGGAGTSADALAIGVSGVLRKFDLAEFSATPTTTVSTTSNAYSIDAFIPIIPSSMDDRGNALSFTGSFQNGSGTADLYTGLSGGVAFPALPGGGTYTPNVDNGLAVFYSDGTLHTVDWRSYIVGLQYYLPPSGKIWVSGNFSQMYSGNALTFGAPSRIFDRSWWADGNLFFDITPAVRTGLEYAYFHQTYGDGANASNHRFQLSAWYIF